VLLALTANCHRDPKKGRALEYGGTSATVEGLRGRRRKRRIKVAARPYMGPAFEQEKPKLPAMWAGSIR